MPASPSNEQGTLFLVTASSGVGKTTLVRELLKQVEDITLSISYTTRPPRVGEESGVAYHFVDEFKFQEMVAEDAFVEYAQVFGNWYGTSWQAINAGLDHGQDVLLEIDWQGATQVCQRFKDAVSIFVLPPSRDELEQRLRTRGKDEAMVIQRRLMEVAQDVKQIEHFDFWLVNKNFNQAVTELKAIVTAERLKKRVQRVYLAEILDNLSQDV